MKKADCGICKSDPSLCSRIHDDELPQPDPRPLEDTERERIRKIWRPLYDLGYKGHEQIDAQHMAYALSIAVDETQALIDKAVVEARIDELEKAVLQFIFNTANSPNNFSGYATDRLAQLKEPKE